MFKFIDKQKSGKKQFKLQTKLFFIYVVVTETIVLSFAFFFYQYMASNLIDNELKALDSLNSSIIVQVDAAIEDLDNVSANINYSTRIIGKQDESFNVPFTTEKLNQLAEVLTTINGIDLESHQINIYDFEGNVARMGLRNNLIKVNLNLLGWLDEVIELDGLKLISKPYRSTAYFSDGDWYISLYRTFSSPYGEKVGAIEAIRRCTSVFKSIISYEKKEDSGIKTYIYDSDGVLIYPYIIVDTDDKYLFESYYAAISSGEDINQHINPLTGQREYLVYETSIYSGWTYLSIQREDIVLEPVTSLVKWILIIVGIIFILALAVSYLLAKNMIKPIIKLKEIFQGQALDTLSEKVGEDHYTSYAELAEVYNDYNIMNEKLHNSMNDLIESRNHEIKARMSALQAQTNPHFFYNTLSSIIVLSENGQNEEIVQLCRNLTKLMRYITDNYVNKVQIRQELEYVGKYLYCMKVRYQSSLSFEYDIDDELMDIVIPKLSIQPLVENAIKHGTDCIPPWKITIKGRKTDSGWYITVMDSGNGFKPEVLESLEENKEKYKITSEEKPTEFEGFGLMNVYIRLKYFFQDSMVFEFGNTEKGHGYVTIGQTNMTQNGDTNEL